MTPPTGFLAPGRAVGQPTAPAPPTPAPPDPAPPDPAPPTPAPTRYRHGHDGDRGSVTLWLLGLCVIVLFVGGLSFELWHAFSQRRALAGIADSAAAAAATAIDEHTFRHHGHTRLEPQEAAHRAAVTVAAHSDQAAVTAYELIGFNAELTTVTVAVEGEVALTLTRLLAPGAPPLALRVEATALARPAP